jgi:hypothetical protein
LLLSGAPAMSHAPSSAAAGAGGAAEPPLAGPGPVLTSQQVFGFAEQARLAKAANEAYLATTPALARLLRDLVRACVVAQPADAAAFAREYVRRYDGAEPDRGQVAPDLGITAPGYVREGLAMDSLALDEDEEEGEGEEGDEEAKR